MKTCLSTEPENYGEIGRGQYMMAKIFRHQVAQWYSQVNLAKEPSPEIGLPRCQAGQRTPEIFLTNDISILPTEDWPTGLILAPFYPCYDMGFHRTKIAARKRYPTKGSQDKSSTRGIPLTSNSGQTDKSVRHWTIEYAESATSGCIGT